MIGIGLLALLQVAGAPNGTCIMANEVQGTERAWFRNGETIVFENRKYVKYGLPREGIVEYVELLGNKTGVPITGEKGVREHEVIYLLAEKAGCAFQPYQVEPN